MSRYQGSDYRPPRSSLRDAPPLPNYDRPRGTFRDREYERQRSPPRNFNTSANSSYPDNSFPSAPFRGGFSRGRGRGDYDYRGRAVRHERDLFRPRERSPPRHIARRGEDDRRSDWSDRERELDRGRRDPLPPSRADSRPSSDAAPGLSTSHQALATPSINPERLAILESTGADAAIRRPSLSQASSQPPRELRRDPPPETPAYLNGRALQRGSSPPTQAPPSVPAFSFSVPPAATSLPQAQAPKPPVEPKPAPVEEIAHSSEVKPASEEKSAPPANAPTAPRAAPPGPKALLSSPLMSAPKAPRALEADSATPAPNRLQGVRSLESLSGPNHGIPTVARQDPVNQPSNVPPSPGSGRQSFHLTQPISPNTTQGPRFGELAAAPTGPRAARPSPAHASVSPRPPLASSPRSDIGSFQPVSGPSRAQTPPLSAPSGPRRQSYSVSPRATHSSVPTAPRSARVPPIAPRAGTVVFPPSGRPPPDRPANAPPPTAPSGPRGHHTWNQWRRPSGLGFSDKPMPSIPAKRDFNGEEKDKGMQAETQFFDRRSSTTDIVMKLEDHESSRVSDGPRRQSFDRVTDHMDVDHVKPALADGHSAAQSFFGKQLDVADDDIDSSSEDDELDEDQDATLLEAKHARKERELRSRMIDLSIRDYRATTPLESIARLARISMKDLQRLNERDPDMDVDEHVSVPRLAIPATQSSDSDEAPDIVTPTGDESKLISIRDQDGLDDTRRRLLRHSPEVISLPYLVKPEDVVPFEDHDSFHGHVKLLQASEDDLVSALRGEYEAEEDIYDDVGAEFIHLYRQWREECEELDRFREEQERLERQQSQEPAPEFEGSAPIPSNPIVEGRRIHKYSSEYDVEQVLKQSEETARIEREMLEREAKKVQADMEKEAWLPDQLPEDVIAQRTIIDVNGLREPESLTLVFSYEPPPDNFTETEQSIFIAAFKDTPKKWGEIASLLPDRSYKDCIHHYYANKWDGRFRDNRAKKLKGGRRGRGGKPRPGRGSALMADLNRGEDLMTAPNVSDSGRPKRAAAPTTFGEKDPEQKAAIMGTSPAKKTGQSKNEAGSEAGSDGRVKRQKRTGEKPGRKAKSQLTTIAAAPTALSDGKPIVQSVQSKEELAQAQDLEHASLLTGFHSGHAMPFNSRVNFANENLQPQPGPAEDHERQKSSASTKPSASSYWSGPERTDFLRYIAHFGTDFAAIAAHMGTKTQIMIKNHYQRQIDGGGRADLEDTAMQANRRRQQGEDLGPPPIPTPIVKRKYDNPQTTAPRPLAPQTESIDMDEQNSSKHASPPQFQSKPRFVSSVATTPVQASRIVPSPVPTTVAPASTVPTPGSHVRPMQPQHSLGSPFYPSSESHFESRSGMQKTQMLRGGSETAVTTSARNPMLHPHPNRTPANDPEFMNNLRQEQTKAFRLEAEHAQPEQLNQRYRQTPIQYPSGPGLQNGQSAPVPTTDRKQLPVEDKTPTPPRPQFPTPGSNLTRPLFGSTPMSSLSTPLSSRNTYNPSPPKHDISRPASVAGGAHLSAPHASAPALEPPKKSTINSLLNSDPEEPRAVQKHDPVSSAPTRTASPAYISSAPQANQGISSARRDPFPPSQPPYQRGPYSQPPNSSNAPPPSLKQEPLSASSAYKPDWASQVLNQSNTPSPMEKSLTYELKSVPRQYFPHPPIINGLVSSARNNASPPPHAMNNHSRASSLTGTAPGPPRDRPIMGGMSQSSSHQSVSALHPNPFAQPQYAQDHRPQHSHNNSMNDNMSMHRRMPSSLNPEEMGRAHHARERSEQEYRMRGDPMHLDRHHQSREDHHAQHVRRQQQEQQDYDRSRQQVPPPSMGRGPPQIPPQSMPPSGYTPAYAHGLDMQEHARREERRRMEDNERRRHQDMPHQHGPQTHSYMPGDRDPQPHGHYRVRPDEPYPQRTPLGGPYAPPPPSRR